MKLYTEEQILEFLENKIIFDSDDLNELTPIELPSDEEIKKEMEFDWLDPYDVAYLGGAIWMRDKLTNVKEK